MIEVTVKNPMRSRKWGWGWSTTPTGEDAYSIQAPSEPDYTGTYNQVKEARARDKAFNNLGGAFYNTRWFFDGREITGFKQGQEDVIYPWSMFDPEFDEGPITLVLK